MVPEYESIVRVDGSPVALQDNGGLPPVAAIGAVYGRPAEPPGSDAVVNDRAGATVMFRLDVAAPGGTAESVTIKLMVNVPLTVGIPEILPVRELIERPAGRPVVSDQLNGATPPLVAAVAL